MSNEESRGSRDNNGKPKWALVDFNALLPLVAALEYGMGKYGRDNWTLGLDRLEIIESMLRHVFALLRGENIDSESGVKHIGHVMANAMFLSYFDSIPTACTVTSEMETTDFDKLMSIPYDPNRMNEYVAAYKYKKAHAKIEPYSNDEDISK